MAMEEPDLWGEVHPALPTDTREVGRGARGGSVEAAKIPDRPEKYIEILNLLRREPMIDDRMAVCLPAVHPGTLSKRRLRLERAGLVEDTMSLRPTRQGVYAILWAITDKGREVLAAWERAE